MRIAIYYNLPSGGAKRLIHETTRRLSEEHKFDVYSLSTANHEFCDLRPFANRYTIYPFKPSSLLSSPFGRLNQAIRLLELRRLQRLQKEISRAIRGSNYDLLLCHPCQFESAPSVLNYLESIPKVYYCHEPLRVYYEEMPYRPYRVNSRRRELLDKVDPLPGLYYRTLSRDDWRNIHRADAVLVNSNFNGQAVKRIYGIDCRVSYPGVDIETFNPKMLEKEHIVLSVGSLTPLKGFDFLIQALNCLPAASRPRLVIASNFQNPDEKTYLEALAVEHQVQVEFLSDISDATLVSLYNRARVTLYAPIREPFGLVPLESLACGTPVVAVREGGVQETMIDGQTGFLAERDTKQFADAVQRLLSDPGLAARCGDFGREYVRSHWTWEIATRALESHLSDQVGSSNAG